VSIACFINSKIFYLGYELLSNRKEGKRREAKNNSTNQAMAQLIHFKVKKLLP